jgi:V/A-type H+-transporting ATPase subunit B
MNVMIQLYAACKESREKRSMGFKMSAWDDKLLKYGERFEHEMMDLSVNIPLEQALDLGWRMLADCFEPAETGIATKLLEKFWPKSRASGTQTTATAGAV